ncbi:hypothetical protein NMY22_g10782 [Coprinellus aureogranulatus]|nr:hypothetical protein NMY22_g10782 [Coprinellus aureogranulatus]
MSPGSPGTSIPAGTSAHRDRQLLKLLRSARTVEPGSLEAVGKYIVQEKNLAGISTILDALHSSHIPKKPTTLHELASAARLSTLAEDALDDLATISLALNQIRALKEPAPIIKKAFQAQRLLAELLVGRWASVTKWISFFLKQSESSGNSVESELKLVYSCCRALTAPVSAHVKDDPFTEELVTHSSTVNLVLRLLCRQDVHRRGRYYDLLLRGTSCLITNLFALVHDSEEGCDAMEAALKALSGQRRRAVVSALTSRAQDLVLRGIEDGRDQKLLYAVDSLAYLLGGIVKLIADSTIRKEFHRQDFLTRYSEAIFLASQTTQAEPTVHSKAEPGFWSRLGWCVLTLLQGGFVCFATHPAVCLPGLIEAGILSAGAACLRHLAGHIASEGKSIIVHALETVLPYMYLSGVFDAALKRGDLRFWEAPPVELQASSTASVAALVQDFQLSISLTRRTLVDRQRRTINLCSNIWAQDWSELHFRECRGLFEFYDEHKAQGAWTPMKVRVDQVRSIDTYMNSMNLSPSEMQAQDFVELPPFVPGATTYPIHYQSGIPPQPGGSLAILDYFTAGLGKGVRFRPRVSLESHLETMWNGPSIDLWLLRMRRYIQTVEDDPEHTILVEASFQFNNVYMMLVLARMRYSPLALEGERYTCLNSFMRLMERYEVSAVVRRTGRPGSHLEAFLYWYLPPVSNVSLPISGIATVLEVQRSSQRNKRSSRPTSVFKNSAKSNSKKPRRLEALRKQEEKEREKRRKENSAGMLKRDADLPWEKMSEDGMCDRCHEKGLDCYRVIEAADTRRKKPYVTNAMKVWVGNSVYSRCQECKVRDAKCRMSEQSAEGTSPPTQPKTTKTVTSLTAEKRKRAASPEPQIHTRSKKVKLEGIFIEPLPHHTPPPGKAPQADQAGFRVIPGSSTHYPIQVQASPGPSKQSQPGSVSRRVRELEKAIKSIRDEQRRTSETLEQVLGRLMVHSGAEIQAGSSKSAGEERFLSYVSESV